MKKISLFLLGTFLIIILSACSRPGGTPEEKISDPVSDPGGYVQDMTNLNKTMRENIQKSTDQENKKIDEALEETSDGASETNLREKYSAALISTNFGDIKIKLDSANAPKTVENYLKLANSGFYNGTKFHRVIKNFMVQGGDPLSKDDNIKSRWGTGGPGYKFDDELRGTEKYTQGTLAMANSGPDTNGSQFFIVTASPSYPLPPSYTVFGHVVSGMDAVLKIENVKTEVSDRPVADVEIKSIKPLEN